MLNISKNILPRGQHLYILEIIPTTMFIQMTQVYNLQMCFFCLCASLVQSPGSLFSFSRLYIAEDVLPYSSWQLTISIILLQNKKFLYNQPCNAIKIYLDPFSHILDFYSSFNNGLESTLKPSVSCIGIINIIVMMSPQGSFGEG